MAFRILRKNKLFSSINIFGLSISMAACLLIFQYAFYELSFDRQFSRDIFRLGNVTYQNGTEYTNSSFSSFALASALKEKLPEVNEVVRMYSTSGWFDCSLLYQEGESVNVFNENRGFYFTDPSFLSVFDVQLTNGTRAAALSQPFSIVLSETSARKYFGKSNPIGKILTLRGSFQTHDYTVTGVMKDFPSNSHLDPKIIASLSSFQTEVTDVVTYAKLNHPEESMLTEAKINHLAASLLPKLNNQETKFILEPITSIHLHSKLVDQFKPSGNAHAVYFLMVVAIIILFIAWINYVNLTTARSVARAKEIGIRKVTGASRVQISFQFLTETFVINGLSFIIALVFVFAMATPFYTWIGETSMRSSNPFLALHEETIAIMIVFILGTIVSGLIPSQFISGVNPANVLKGKWVMLRSRFSFRQVAVVFQFTTAFILAISILVFQKQFNFIRSQDLGIDINNSIVLQAPTNVDSTYVKRLHAFKSELQSLSIVQSIATSADVPGTYIGADWSGDVRKEKDGLAVSFGVNVIDPDFIKQFQLKLLAGRDFEQQDFPLQHFGDKVESVILTRNAVQRLGFTKPEEAIDRIILWGKNKCRIVGVIDDYHQQSVKEAITPLLLVANMGPSLTLKLAPGVEKNIADAITQIREAWNKYFPANAFDYYFLEDHFNKQYASDEMVARLFNFFCLLALIISSMGLFALSLLSAQQRTREVSIRKILGAPVLHLMRLLSQEYLLLLIVASAIAIPLSYYGISEWLMSFAWRIELDGTLFIIPVIVVMTFALLTVSSQVIKVIGSNPTENLKHE